MRIATSLAALASVLLLAGCFPQTPPVASPTTGTIEEGPASAAAANDASKGASSDVELDGLARKERRQWRYEQGNPHTYNSAGAAGRFFQSEGTAWKHQVDAFPDDAKDFEEVSRTDEYVELKDWTGTQIYRLYDDRFESKASHLPEFGKLGAGRWTPLPDPREAAQIVAARRFWRYENAPDIFPNQASHAGVFRQKDARFWEEQGVGSGLSTYEETARTGEYVELAKLDGGFFVRLYPGRSEWRYGNETAFKPMFPGAWVGDGKLPEAK